MPSYRLLRSNKESGPYTLNDLVTLGLKPYDLVWIDGKSAAWRYPSEIAELKEYSPIVEEQPFDRFYKKPFEIETPIKETTVSSDQKLAVQQKTINENFAKEEPVKKVITEIQTPSYQHQPKKQVFVSMPESNGFDPYKNPYQDEKYEQYLPKQKPVQEQQKSLPVEEKSYSPINIRESEETKLETKYTQSLDDIKEMYVNTLVQRKTKNRRKEIIKKYVRPALIPVLLLIAGVAIGYVITNKKSSLQASQPVSTVTPHQTTPEQKNEEIPADNKILQPDENQNLTSKTDNEDRKSINHPEQVLIQPKKQNKIIETLPKQSATFAKKKNETNIPDEEIATVQKKNVEVDPNTGERKKVVRDNDEITAKENNARNNFENPSKKNNSERSFIETDHKNIRELVSVKSNNYIRGAFGGIKGLELTVYNNSGFLLDEVNVELQIMKPSEQPLRTDIITFKNIAANGAITVKVPDSQRGIRVDYRITNIESKQWQKSTAGL